MTRETLREQLISAGAIRPLRHKYRVYRTDGLGIVKACAIILRRERAIAPIVAVDPSTDPRVRRFLARALEGQPELN